ncbi:unnamed protein product, partial [Rotaria sordida]
GVSMGSPLAPILADIFMTYIEQQIEEYEYSDKIKLYTLTFRALSICSSKRLLEEQCELIERTMICNGYPVNLVKRKIKNTIEQYHNNRSTIKNKIKTKEKKLFIPLTYYGDETIIMSNKIKNIIKSLFPTFEIIFGYKKGTTLAKLFTKNFKGKDPMEIGVVYKLTCKTCDQVYIGQTKLNINERMKQHKEGLRKPETSRAADHMINNKNHRKYLQLEYYQKSKNSLKQQLEVEALIKSLKNKINSMEYELLNKHFEKLKQNKRTEIRLAHKIKIEKLSKGDVKLDIINPKKVVHNISSRSLTEDEESILAKGLQFCIETKIKNPIEFKTEIEMMAFSILKQLHKPHETSLNSSLTECIQRAANQALKINKNKKIINVNKNELIALKSLIKDQNIVIMKADKGSVCVIMDKDHYKSKVFELLSTGTSFKKMNELDERGKPNTIEHVVKKMESKLDHRLKELKKAKRLSQDDYDYIHCTGSRCSVLFCNPKIHKEGMPLRPIISTTNSYNYKLAKYLTKLVEDARQKPKSYVKDSFSFARLIQLKQPAANDIMISLDVESLFTNVPVYEAVELAIKIIIDKKKIDKNYSKLTAKDLRNLFQLAVTNTLFRFYDQLYIQVDGVSMGSPLAPILADIFMTYIEQQIEEYEYSDKIKLYVRYVD